MFALSLTTLDPASPSCLLFQVKLSNLCSVLWAGTGPGPVTEQLRGRSHANTGATGTDFTRTAPGSKTRAHSGDQQERGPSLRIHVITDPASLEPSSRSLFHFAAPANLKISPFGSSPFTNSKVRSRCLRKNTFRRFRQGFMRMDYSAGNPTPYAHLVILRQDVVHVRHILACDLLDDQRAVIGVQQETFSLVIGTPGWGTAGQ